MLKSKLMLPAGHVKAVQGLKLVGGSLSLSMHCRVNTGMREPGNILRKSCRLDLEVTIRLENKIVYLWQFFCADVEWQLRKSFITKWECPVLIT